MSRHAWTVVSTILVVVWPGAAQAAEPLPAVGATEWVAVGTDEPFPLMPGQRRWDVFERPELTLPTSRPVEAPHLSELYSPRIDHVPLLEVPQWVEPLAPFQSGSGTLWSESTPSRRAITGKMNAASWAVTGALLAGSIALLASEDVDAIHDAGDVPQVLLPVMALSTTFMVHDRQGMWQFLKSFVTSLGTVHILKTAIDKSRPDQSDPNSYPSAHTVSAFSGAAFIQQRYGTRWGVPAYVMAGFVGVSRVVSQNHFLDDVLAGMSVALLANWHFVRPVSEKVAMEPLAVDGGYGVAAKINLAPVEATSAAKKNTDSYDQRRRFRYLWELSDVNVADNQLASPSETGDQFSPSFEGENIPSASTLVDVQWFAAERQDLLFRLAPFEYRELGSFDEDTTFAGVTVPAGFPLFTRYLMYEYLVRWRYDVKQGKHWQVKVGGGLEVVEIVETLADESDIERQAEISEVLGLPVAHLHLGYRFTHKVELFAEADGGATADGNIVNALALLRIHLSPRWDLGLGYRRVAAYINTAKLFNQVQRNQAAIQFGYTFGRVVNQR